MSNPQRPRRYSLLLPLRVWIQSWDKSSTAAVPAQEETITENLSAAGCYFLLSKPPEVGSQVQVEIAMEPGPGKKSQSRIMASGKVVRIERERGTGKTGVACQFIRHDLIPTPKPKL